MLIIPQMAQQTEKTSTTTTAQLSTTFMNPKQQERFEKLKQQRRRINHTNNNSEITQNEQNPSVAPTGSELSGHRKGEINSGLATDDIKFKVEKEG